VNDAASAAKQCRFEPGKLNGKPTGTNVDLKYQFELVEPSLVELYSNNSN
jgi:hypothetical protein